MLRNYYDLHVTTDYSVGKSGLADVVRMAERLGLGTIVLMERLDDSRAVSRIRGDISKLDSSVNVLLGVEIVADNKNELYRKVDEFRDKVDIVGVFGGDLDINRYACENPKVDVLIHPELKRKDSGMDHVMMRLAAENNVAIELNFGEYLHSYKKIRSFVISHMTRNVMLAKHYGAHVIVSSGAQSVWDMRAGRELASLAYLCGLDREKAVRSVSEIPAFILKRNAEINGRALKGGVKL